MGVTQKKRLERYKKAEQAYNEAVSARNKAKQDRKTGAISKSDYKTARANVRSAKKQLESEYNKLKTDKMADEGKELYKSGKTITRNAQENLIRQGMTIVASNLVGATFINAGAVEFGAQAAHAILVGGTIGNVIVAVKAENQNKKLRAYYAH